MFINSSCEIACPAPNRYGFGDEVKHKYGNKTMSLFMNAFRQLPVAAVIRTVPASVAACGADRSDDKSGSSRALSKASKPQKKKGHTRLRGSRSTQKSDVVQHPCATPCLAGERRVLVMHGGLFRNDASRREGRLDVAALHEVLDVSRHHDDPEGSMIEDVLWSDPQVESSGVCANKLRGCGVLFGKTTLDYFLKKNQLHGMIRAHEGPDMRVKRPGMADMMQGYSVDMEVASGFLATVFSAADYRTLNLAFVDLAPTLSESGRTGARDGLTQLTTNMAGARECASRRILGFAQQLLKSLWGIKGRTERCSGEGTTCVATCRGLARLFRRRNRKGRCCSILGRAGRAARRGRVSRSSANCSVDICCMEWNELRGALFRFPIRKPTDFLIF